MTLQSLQPQGDDGKCEEGEFSSSWCNTLPLWIKLHLGFCGSVSIIGCAPCQTQSSCHSLQNILLCSTSHGCHVHTCLSDMQHGAFFTACWFLMLLQPSSESKGYFEFNRKTQGKQKIYFFFLKSFSSLHKENPAHQEALAVLCRQAKT